MLGSRVNGTAVPLDSCQSAVAHVCLRVTHLSRRRRRHRLTLDHTRANKAKWTHLEVDICSQTAIIAAFSVVEERMKHAGLIINPAAAEFCEKPVGGLRLKRIFFTLTWFI